MDLEKLKRERTISRSAYTKTKNRFVEKCKTQEDLDAIQVTFELLREKAEILFEIEDRVKRMWLEALDYTSTKEFEDDCDTADDYRYSWAEQKIKYNKIFPGVDARSRCSSEGHSFLNDAMSEKSKYSNNYQSVSNNSSACKSKRNFVLPKIEFVKFDGKIKNWLNFWGQFKKIDGDDTIDNDDKFQYLLQTTVPGSSARELVESFPPSGDSYKAALEQMKARFARDDLLIEIYVRELLNLVLVQTKIGTPSLSSLYDKLNTQLRALRTLGVTSDKYAALLYPLVESALPEDLLRAWERSRGHTIDTPDNLQNLLEFVRKEVESEERILISRNSLSVNDDDSSSASATSYTKQPTASCLISTEAKRDNNINMCIWCEKSHNSLECFKAAKMTLDERKAILMKKGICFVCLKSGHISKNCTNNVRCVVCSRRHTVLLCPGLVDKTETASISEKPKEDKNYISQNQAITEMTVSQKSCNTNLLQTLMVKIEHAGKSLTIRAFIDSGAQRSYIRRDIVQSLSLKPNDRVTLAHSLFGGIETDKQEFGIYNLKIKSIDNDFEFAMTALDKTKVCGTIPRLLENDRLKSQLFEKNIYLNDKGENSLEIGLLIGADYSGMIMIGCIIQLENNLTAIKTKLGWTIQGQQKVPHSKKEYVSNNTITDLWVLEMIGIRDPVKIKTKKESEEVIPQYFEKTIKNNDVGHEVTLPRKLSLMNNREIAINRPGSATQNLIKTKNREEYYSVSRDWLKWKWKNPPSAPWWRGYSMRIGRYAGRDGVPRAAKVKMADAEYKRPLQRLYALEL